MTKNNNAIERIAASPYEVEQFFAGHYRKPAAPKRPTVGFKRLTDSAVLPTKAHASDSGYDLCAATDVVIAPGETVVIPTGIAVKLPPGYEATVRPRSGVTSKTKLRAQLGTVDNAYTGEVKVIVDHIGEKGRLGTDYLTLSGGNVPSGSDKPVRARSYIVRAGERIAQLVITRLPELEAVEIDDLGESERGASGFGSTGV